MSTRRVQNLVDFGGFDLELFFATEILKLKSLHYGYWDEAPRLEDITLQSVRDAQARFTERLLSFIPEGVRTVLDVGSGIGDNARALAAKGYIVTAVSPDKNHAKYYGPAGENNITFHNTTFEGFESEQQFDLIFISEALNYFDQDVGLQKCRRYLKPGGHLLVAAMFRYGDSREFRDNYPLTELPYVQKAHGYGFTLLQSKDITPNTLPTMMLSNWAIREYVWPSLEMARRYFAASSPWKFWALKLLFGKQIKELTKILEYYEKRTAPEYFSKSMRYATLLFSLRD